MAIVGTTPADAADQFVRHLNDVLYKTITGCRLRRLETRKGFYIAFDEEDAPDRAITIDTASGAMALSFAQSCDTVPVTGGHRLRTREYAYSLTPSGEDRAWLRWEYVRFPSNPKMPAARHHLQGAAELRPPGRPLNDFHVPTGFVAIEEIIRFCLNDLKVTPRQTDWHDVLLDSYERFRTEFTV